MRNAILMILMIGGISISNVYAQDIFSVDKEVVLKKVDGNTQMAFVYHDNVLTEKGLLKNGKREGVWQSFNSNGNLTAEASFTNGMKEGVWVIYDGSQVKYLLHYQNDKRIKANDLARVD